MPNSLPPDPSNQGTHDLFADDPFFHPVGVAQPLKCTPLARQNIPELR